MSMGRRPVWRGLFGLLASVALVLFAAAPASAYGSNDTWQVAISGTGTAPSTGFGFGFWGWCAFGGGVTSGNDGDCVIAQYFHAPAGSGFTCNVKIDVSSWDGSGGTFVLNAATFTVRPTSLTGPCLAFIPGFGSFPLDLGIPAAAGHYNLGGLGPGLVGEFQIQVVQIP